MALVSIQASPGVNVREIDFSQYVSKISGTILGNVGAAEWGPIGVRQFITSEVQQVSTFGRPMAPPQGSVSDLYHCGGHAQVLFLKEGNQSWFVRIANPATAAKATVTLSTSGAVACLVVTAYYEGTRGNRMRVRIGPADNGNANHFKLEVLLDELGLNNYRVVQRWGSVSNSAADAAAYAPTSNLPQTFIPISVVNAQSRYIQLSKPGSPADPARPANTVLTSLPFGTALTGGNDGTTGITDAMVIGDASNPVGLYQLSDPSQVDINVLIAPGIQGTNAAVITAGVALCESRADCVFVADPPMGLPVTSVIDFTNGTGAYSGQAAFNSSWGCISYPWASYYSTYVGAQVFAPPSAWTALTFAKTDRVAGPQYAPMGLNRGHLSLATSLEINTTKGERELLYGSNNIVNPIVNMPPYGITVWGQRTMQRVDSALDRLNVRRMLIALEKTIATSVLWLVGEPGDPITFRQFVNLVEPALRQMKAARGVRGFQVACNESTNPDEILDQNTIRGIIIVKPTKAAEVIQVDFVITNQGADFNETLKSVVNNV